MANMESVRAQIDAIDRALIDAFEQRMEISKVVAETKRSNNLPISDPKRELVVEENAVSFLKNKEIEGQTRSFIRCAISLSKSIQRNMLIGSDGIMPKWCEPSEPQKVIYQGVPGAFGEQAMLNLYPNTSNKNVDTFEDVFEWVSAGKCDVGIVPIENSSTGAIGQVYNLLHNHGCYIVAETRVKVEHCLLGLPGTDISKVTTIYSHPEGFAQSRAMVIGRPWLQVPLQNTALAAKQVAEKGDNTCVAIASRRAGELYGLDVLMSKINTVQDNSTRFIAVSSKPQTSQTCNRLSISFNTAHKCGALSDVLMAFALAGLNLTRIESRPTSGGEYRFFVDLEASPLNGDDCKAIAIAAASCSYFEVLGSYCGAPSVVY